MKTVDNCAMFERAAVLRALKNPEHMRGRSQKRWNELSTAYLFSEFFSRQHDQEYFIGVTLTHPAASDDTVDRLFDPTFGKDDDVDLVLAPRNYEKVQSRENLRRVQVTRFVNRTGGTASLTTFLGERKLKTQPDPTLLLLVSVDEPGQYDFPGINRFLRGSACPFGMVFLIGPDDRPLERTVFCVQVYPSVSEIQPEAGMALTFQ